MSKQLKKIKKIKHISLKSLRKKAWSLQSEYIRRSENYICFTCGVHLTKATSQAGHYIHKDCLDFDSVNIHCQCVRCNKWLSGNQGIYAERLIADYGLDAILDLRRRAEVVRKFNVGELSNLIEDYKQKISAL